MACRSDCEKIPFGSPLSQMVRDSRLSQKSFTWSSEPHGDFFYQVTVLEQLGDLIEYLAQYMRKRSISLRKEDPNFQTYQNILCRLRQEFDVGIYNLNYDNVAISAWPEAFTGFKDGEFDPQSVVLRRNWGFVYHLHGSVHFSLDPSGTRITWNENLNSAEFKSVGPVQQMGEAHKPLLLTTLIAGGFKLDHLLADPFQTFCASLIRHAHEADAFLIAGYGFGDVHVNRALQNRCSLFPFEQSRRPRVVVLEKTDPRVPPTGFRYDLWEVQVQPALSTGFWAATKSIEQIVKENGFEYDLQKRVAIWHGGFVEADNSLDKVIDWLTS
jgi:hypothetical protein